MPENIDNEYVLWDESGEQSGGVDDVVSTLEQMSPYARRPNVRRMNGPDLAYTDWVREQTPENMSKLLDALAPTINSEVTRYSGSPTLLRSKAKVLAVNAIKTYNPMQGTKLSSWVVTGLKPLARYSIKQRDIKIPEVAARQAAELDSVSRRMSEELGRDPTDEELADETGLSVKRIRSVRSKAVASVTSGRFDEQEGEDASLAPAVQKSDPIPFAQEAVYQGLSDMDRFIFDAATGSHGVKQLPAIEVAGRLGVSPATVSQKAKAIGNQIAYVVNHA